MDPRYRPHRALEMFPVRLRGERRHRTVEAILHPRCENADHTAVPVLAKQRDRRVGDGVVDRVEQRGRLGLHPGLDGAPLGIQGIELGGDTHRLVLALAQQAFDAAAHVGQPACRVEPGPRREAQIRRDRVCDVASRHPEQRGHAGARPPRPDPPQPLLDENAVVPIEGDDVGHRAQRDEVEERGQIRRLAASRALAPPGTQRSEHVEHHPDSGEALARESVAGAVGIDDGVGRGQSRAGQMVIGDQDVDAELLRAGDPVHARDAVVDGDDETGLLLARDLDEFRRQSVAVAHAVGHHKPHVGGPEHPQAAHRDRASGRAVGVVVPCHHDARRRLDGVVEQRDGAVEVEEPAGGEQAGERMVEIGVAPNRARGEHAAQHGMAVRQERRIEDGRRAALDTFHAALRASHGTRRHADRIIGLPSSGVGEAMVSPPGRARRRTGAGEDTLGPTGHERRRRVDLFRSRDESARRWRLKPSGHARRRFSPRARRAATTGSVPGGSRRTGGRARRRSRRGRRRRCPARRAAVAPMSG